MMTMFLRTNLWVVERALGFSATLVEDFFTHCEVCCSSLVNVV